MRTYPLFVGETVSDKLTIAFPPALRNLIETECRAAWRELNTIEHPNETSSPFVPYDELMRTEEGRTHMYLAQNGFFVNNSIQGYPAKKYAVGLSPIEYNAMLSRLQAQRYTTQGRRRRVAQQAASAAAYRKFRSWWLSKHLAEQLGAEVSEPCPFKRHTSAGPTESFIEMGRHFEEWTGHKLPKELWAELKKWEAERLAQRSKEQLAA